MTEWLAFFCHRDTPGCHLYTWADPDAAGDTLYQVHCRAALDDPAPGTDAPSIAAADLSARITAAGGGLIAATRPVGSGAELRVTRVPAAGADAATDLLVLAPGQEPAWQPLGPDALTLAPGAFALLPATGADQADLLALLAHLARLPGDYRGLLLNVLRRPGIEGALWRLEGRLGRLAEQLGPAAADAHPDTAPPPTVGTPWPWVLAALLALNLLTTLGGAWWGRSPPDAAALHPRDAPTAPGGIRHPAPPPGPAGSGCGSPWFFDSPLAPAAPGPADGGPAGAAERRAERSRP